MIKSSRLLGAVCASVFIAATFAIAASAADAATLSYEVVDRFDPFKTDPDGNLVPGDPLDKGFSVTGTMDAVGLGPYDQGGTPFQRWNITETVVNSNGSLSTYAFTESNSAWRLDQSPFVLGVPVVSVDPDNILLLQAFIATTPPTEAENTLFLESTALDQRIFWFVPAFGSDSLFASQKISTGDFNGIYEPGAGGNLQIGRRVSEVPVPAAVWLFGSGLLGLIGVARRKKAA